MSNKLMHLLNNQQHLTTSQGKFISVFDPTQVTFWCSESGNEMNCTRQWVQSWELFNIVKDDFSGATMLQSNQTKCYATLMQDNTIKCIQNRSVRETHFKIDENNGTFKACNEKFVAVNQANKYLMANSDIPVGFQICDVKTVAISDPATSNYAYPRDNVISMGSKTPYTFYLIYNRMTEETYLETSAYEFIIPNNSVDPITYKKTPIDVNNYRLKVDCVNEAEGIYTILAEATNRYFSRQTTQQYGDVIYANSEIKDGQLQKFKITPTR